MHVLSQEFTVSDIKATEYEKTPRATLISNSSKIAIDYYAELCHLKQNENVRMDLYLQQKPEINEKIYLMRGIVYKIEENRFEASFGGLLMFYEGNLVEDLELEKIIYVSISKL